MSSNHSIDEPSICIPRVSRFTTSESVREVFSKVLGQGAVERVDIVPWRGRGPDAPRRVFVHLRAWPTTAVAQRMRARLLGGDDVDLVYDDPWIWRCSRSRVPKPSTARAYDAEGRGVRGGVGRAGLAPALAAVARACT